jgi:hypothetical protein
MTKPDDGFSARCRHCGMVLHVVGPRLTADALAMLRDHVRAVHPAVTLPPDADAGAVLRHFDITR